MQIAANSMANWVTADYPRYSLRKEAVSEVDVVRRSQSKNNLKLCQFQEQAGGDKDICMIYDTEQVFGCRLNIPGAEVVKIDGAIVEARN